MEIDSTTCTFVALYNGTTISDIREWLAHVESLGLGDDTPLTECVLSCEKLIINQVNRK